MRFFRTGSQKIISRFDSDGMPIWTDLTYETFKECLEQNVEDAVLMDHFSERLFFGSLVQASSPKEMKHALSILRATKLIHLAVKDAVSDLSHELEAQRVAADLFNRFKANPVLTVSEGKGYIEWSENSFQPPTCHILHAEVKFEGSYAAWFNRRLEAWESIGKLYPSERIGYLYPSHECKVVSNGMASILEIDVYGQVSVSSEWDEWLDEYESSVGNLKLTGLELAAGFLHLADTFATIHLMSALPIIVRDAYTRRLADDSLTDFWRLAYDITSSDEINIGCCPICGELYIGTSSQKQGHAACMNKQRTKKSKARAFARAVESGTTPQEAARSCSISPKTAIDLLAMMGHAKLEGVDYGQ